MRKFLKVVTAMAAVLAGCAYFNTFYNAKQYFYEAEKEYREKEQVTANARLKYRNAIEKCAKVLEFYPKSRYVDDALYIMGTSYARVGELDKAKRKFEELLRYYPDSPYVPKAQLELAKLFLEFKEYARAKALLGKLKKEQREEGEYFLAKSFFQDEQYKDVLELVDDFLKRYPKSKFRKKMLLLGAKAALKEEKFELAEQYLNEYLRGSLTDTEKKEGQELLGDVLMMMGQYDEALKVYNSIDLMPNSPEEARVELKKARVFEGKGDIEKAKEVYRGIIEAAKTGGTAAIEAKYRLAVLLESQDSLKEAQKLFEEASKMFGVSEYKEKAALRSQALRSLLNIEDKSNVEAQMKLAMLYLFELNKPEEALEIFEDIYENNSDSKIAPKILYSIIYIRYKKFGDIEGAKEAFRLLEERFGNSIYYEEAMKNFPELVQANADTLRLKGN